MDKFFEFAPLILVLIVFFWQYKVFVTPEQMEKRFTSYEGHLENKFVQKETYNVTVSEMKADIEDIKEKLDKIYEKLMQG